MDPLSFESLFELFHATFKMNINDLPDDCLLLIFDQFYQFRQFATLMKVCRRWKTLAEKGLKKITHLDVILTTTLMKIQDSIKQSQVPSTRKCIITIYCDNFLLINRKRLKKIKLSKLLPNVKIIHLENYNVNCRCTFLVHLLANANQIKGLSGLGHSFEVNHKCKILKREEKRITSFLSDIQFLGISNDLIVTSYLRTFGHFKKLKSLGNAIGSHHQTVNLLHVLKFAQDLPNLEQLVTFCGDEFDYHFVQLGSQLPIFGNLLHLQLVDTSKNGSTVSKFLNLCPNLLNLSLGARTHPMILFNQINKNFNVQRLNLLDWDREKILETIEKFPNCRYLSICDYYFSLSSHELIQIMSVLPHLSLLYIKSDTTDLAEKRIVKNYCHSRNPKIDLYFGSTDEKLLMSNELYRKFHDSFL
ncbi:uncharacterized protein LOC128394241 [Panonychus citri]|uniref:uncharacterized protein LOC128394241 n=1 Tax=Panonychus citri TaxID=50023 RepID=UPI0023072437|nr:uncharacterized protein LOC128394241 [Panonychus citri]